MLIFENRLAASEFITIRWCSVATLARVTEIIKQRRGWRGPFWPAMAHVRNAEHGRAEKPEIISTKSSPPRFIAVIRHFLSRDSPPPFARPRRSGSLRFKRPRDRYAKLNLRVRAWSNYSYEVSFFFFFLDEYFDQRRNISSTMIRANGSWIEEEETTATLLPSLLSLVARNFKLTIRSALFRAMRDRRE